MLTSELVGRRRTLRTHLFCFFWEDGGVSNSSGSWTKRNPDRLPICYNFYFNIFAFQMYANSKSPIPHIALTWPFCIKIVQSFLHCISVGMNR